MNLLRQFVQGIRALFRKDQLRQELDEELQSFTEAVVEQKIRAGLGGEEALRAARTELGSAAAVLASYVPARQATKVDVMSALRDA